MCFLQAVKRAQLTTTMTLFSTAGSSDMEDPADETAGNERVTIFSGPFYLSRSLANIPMLNLILSSSQWMAIYLSERSAMMETLRRTVCTWPSSRKLAVSPPDSLSSDAVWRYLQQLLSLLRERACTFLCPCQRLTPQRATTPRTRSIQRTLLTQFSPLCWFPIKVQSEPKISTTCSFIVST